MSVYKLTDGEKVYYGSTTQLLKQRLSKHKSSDFYGTRDMNKGNMTIELLEEVEDKEQLLWRERFYIENNECVNKRLPIITKEERLEEMTKYNNRNKEHMKQEKGKPFQCECGSVITWGHKSHHFKTKKHIKFINNIDE